MLPLFSHHRTHDRHWDEPANGVLEAGYRLDEVSLGVDTLPEHLELAHLQQVRQVQDLGYLNTSWKLFTYQCIRRSSIS